MTATAFKRVTLSPPPTVNGVDGALTEINSNVASQPCLACGKQHVEGYCPLKHAGLEHCPLCGIAHYGHYRTCPHLSSVTQCQKMLDALKKSTESQLERKIAKQYIVGIIADLSRRRRLKEQEVNGTNGTGGHLVSQQDGAPGQVIPISQVNGSNRPAQSALVASQDKPQVVATSQANGASRPTQQQAVGAWPKFGDHRDETGERPTLEYCLQKGLIHVPDASQQRATGNFLILSNGVPVWDVHGALIPSGPYVT